MQTKNACWKLRQTCWKSRPPYQKSKSRLCHSINLDFRRCDLDFKHDGLDFEQGSLNFRQGDLDFLQVGKMPLRFGHLKCSKMVRCSFDKSLSHCDIPVFKSKWMLTLRLLVLYLVDKCSLPFLAWLSGFQADRSKFQARRKRTKSALAAALKVAAIRDLEPRSKPCLGGPFRK